VLSHVRVTALRPVGSSSQGFSVQDDQGPDFCALSVYSGAAALSVEAGERITVRGYVATYAGAPELIEPSVQLE
jgi:predicted extracellular nuclease